MPKFAGVRLMLFNNRNVTISSKANIGLNVRIGDNTTIYDNVVIGDDSTICNDCVIGEPLTEAYTDENYINPITEIGKNALIRSHSILYAGSSFGINFETGHRVVIRERSHLGDYCRIGTMSDLQGDLKVGNHCQLHSNVHLCKYSDLGDFVFIYPFSVLTNDRYPPSMQVKGPSIGDYSQLGVHSIVVGNVTVGSNCLVGADSTVSSNFEDYSFIIGSPAKRKSDIRNLTDDDGKPLYPWKNRFSRGMPWLSGNE